MVASWISATHRRGEDGYEQRVVLVQVRNSSPQPIFHVLIEIPLYLQGVDGVTVRKWGPSIRDGVETVSQVMIPPKGEHVFMVTVEIQDGPWSRFNEVPWPVTFTDSASQRWHRDKSGRLSESR